MSWCLSNGRVAISSESWTRRYRVQFGISIRSISQTQKLPSLGWSAVSADLYKKDSSFTIEHGAAGKGITFKSVNFPSYSLRHSGSNHWINPHDGFQLFSLDCSIAVIQVMVLKTVTLSRSYQECRNYTYFIKYNMICNVMVPSNIGYLIYSKVELVKGWRQCFFKKVYRLLLNHMNNLNIKYSFIPWFEYFAGIYWQELWACEIARL